MSDDATPAPSTADVVREIVTTPVESERTERERSLEDELEQRRIMVLRLRARRLSLAKIAEHLHVDMSVISRDLLWIRTHWKDLYGARPKFNASEFVGETLATYRDIEASALVEASKSTLRPKDRNAYMRTALEARKQAMEVLQDLGLVQRNLGNVSVSMPSADQIRQVIAGANNDLETVFAGTKVM
jgi:hypothetical protein